MQEYLKRSRLSSLMDGIGIHILVFLLALGWFLILWGLCLPALCAGIALYTLCMVILSRARQGRLIRREKQMRIRIGGEMALERLITAEAHRAHFEIALLLSLRHPLTMMKSGEEGMLCTLRGEYLLISFLQCPISSQVGAEHVLSLQRQCRIHHANRGILCVPCPISPKAQEQARGEIKITFYPKEQLIALLGSVSPATDAQLVALGKRKRAQATARQWMAHILSPRRFSRYVLYGGLLTGMYLITRLPYYLLPGLCCLVLSAACRCKRKEIERL